MAFKIEKLKVWWISMELSVEIHELTKQFPRDELYILTSQIKRAADSVTLNITEASTLQSNVEFKRFLIYANRSPLEVVGCLYIGKKRNPLTDSDFERLYHAYDKLVTMIQALIKSLTVGHLPLTVDRRLYLR